MPKLTGFCTPSDWWALQGSPSYPAFPIRLPMTGATGTIPTLGRAEERAVRPSFLGTFLRVGNVFLCLPESEAREASPALKNIGM